MKDMTAEDKQFHTESVDIAIDRLIEIRKSFKPFALIAVEAEKDENTATQTTIVAKVGHTRAFISSFEDIIEDRVEKEQITRHPISELLDEIFKDVLGEERVAEIKAKAKALQEEGRCNCPNCR